jgi:hypothetical protein
MTIRLGLVVVGVGGLLGCAAHRPAPVAAPETRHNLTAWPDTDRVCVDVPAVQALYRSYACLAMGEIRTVILTTHYAEDGAAR